MADADADSWPLFTKMAVEEENGQPVVSITRPAVYELQVHLPYIYNTGFLYTGTHGFYIRVCSVYRFLLYNISGPLARS